jgi:hypothetical protein
MHPITQKMQVKINRSDKALLGASDTSNKTDKSKPESLCFYPLFSL